MVYLKLVVMVSMLFFPINSGAKAPPPPPARTGKKMPPPPPPGSSSRAQKKLVSKNKQMAKAGHSASGKGSHKLEELPPLEEVQEVKVPVEEKKVIQRKKKNRPVKKAKVSKKKKHRKRASVRKKKKRKPSTVSKSFKGGMHRFRKKCAMHTKPRAGSPKKGFVRAGKKLWVDSHNSRWRKVYKKSGTVFVHRDCF